MTEFEPLFPAEQKLLEACRAGGVASISDDRPDASTEDNRIRASFIRFLALGGDERTPVHEHGVRVKGAWIGGVFDLEGAKTPHGLWFFACHFADKPILRGARCCGPVGFLDCCMPGIMGDVFTCEGPLLLRALIATDTVRLPGAQIGSNLDFTGAKLEGKEGDALSADGAIVKGAVFLEDGFTATGEVRLLGAQISGNLECAGAKLDGKDGNALSADRAVVKGSVFLKDGFTATGGVRLPGAQIGGDLTCAGAKLDGKEGAALSADGAVVKGSVFFKDGFTATGEVRLLGAQIGGNLECAGAKLDGKEGDALSADGAMVKGGMFLRDGFTATGEVRLPGAQIGGDLTCAGAKLDGKEGAALSADGAVVKGDVFLDDGFTATGEVRLLGAQIGGSLICTGAKLDGKEGAALSADRAVVKGGVFFKDGFTATGEVRLLGAQIGGVLACMGATFKGAVGYTLGLERAEIGGGLFFRDLAQPVDRVSLAGARVGRLIDDEASWGKGLVLTGFVYGQLAGGAPVSAESRLCWLGKQSPEDYGDAKQAGNFRPQPWQQLMHVLREMGHNEDARQVAIALEHRLRAVGLIGQTPERWPAWRRFIYRNVVRTGHWLFWVLTGYGHRPVRLLGWMLAVWLACGAFFWFAAEQGVFAPSNPLVFNFPGYAHCRPDDVQPGNAPTAPARVGNWFLCAALAGEYTTFSPMAYSLDVILPLVNLQQEEDWAPIIPTPMQPWYVEFRRIGLNHLTRLVLWSEIVFGWIASLLLVAVVSGLTKREPE